MRRELSRIHEESATTSQRDMDPIHASEASVAFRYVNGADLRHGANGHADARELSYKLP